MVASTPAMRRSTRLRRETADASEAANDAPSSQATEDTSQAPGVSTRRRAARSGVSSGAQSKAPATPAVPTTVRRSRRRQAQQEAESPLRNAGEGAAGAEAQVPLPARRSDSADAPAAAPAAAAEPVSIGRESAQLQLESTGEPPAAVSAAPLPGTGEVAASDDKAAPAATGGKPALLEEHPTAESSSDSEDDSGGAVPTAVQLDEDLLKQLAADMAAALAPQRQRSADGAQHLAGADAGSETDMSDGSSSDGSDAEMEDDRDGGAGPAHGEGLTKAERAALQWVPEARLPPPAVGDETLDRLEAAARRGLAAQAKQVVAPPQDAQRLAREQRKSAPDTAGNSWFDLPATQITPQVKQDLRMLALRGVFDPKRFYRAPDATKFPKYFQMGTVVAGPTDFYSGRLTRKERKQTLTEELLADRQLQAAHKRRFSKLQEESGRFADKKAIAKRKTSNPRLKARRKKPKH